MTVICDIILQPLSLTMYFLSWHFHHDFDEALALPGVRLGFISEEFGYWLSIFDNAQ